MDLLGEIQDQCQGDLSVERFKDNRSDNLVSGESAIQGSYTSIAYHYPPNESQYESVGKPEAMSMSPGSGKFRTKRAQDNRTQV